MLTRKQIEEIEGDLKALRFPEDKSGDLTRYGFYNPALKEGKRFVQREPGYICAANLKRRPAWKDNLPHYHVFNGESPANSSNPRVAFEGGALSLKWLKFLFNEEISPFRCVLPFVENRDDLEKINAETGLIITDYQEALSGAMLGLLIGLRFTQENNYQGQVWEIMVDGGIDPRIAFQIASNFKVTTDGKIQSQSMCCHTIFYAWPAITSKNWYHGLWPEDKTIAEVKGLQSNGEANGSKKHPLYKIYENAWQGTGNPRVGFFDYTDFMPVDELAAKIEKYCTDE